jgi:hypothetical protein
MNYSFFIEEKRERERERESMRLAQANNSRPLSLK